MGQRKGAWASRVGFKERISNWKWFSISNGFWNLARIWKFGQGDFGGILMWGCFLNSFRILNDFRNNAICHAMKCILFKITFKKIFICKINLICNLYALLCWRNFILAKSGCYKHTTLEESCPQDLGSVQK
jgi:hypothetical protein